MQGVSLPWFCLGTALCKPKIGPLLFYIFCTCVHLHSSIHVTSGILDHVGTHQAALLLLDLRWACLVQAPACTKSRANGRTRHARDGVPKQNYRKLPLFALSRFRSPLPFATRFFECIALCYFVQALYSIFSVTLFRFLTVVDDYSIIPFPFPMFSVMYFLFITVWGFRNINLRVQIFNLMPFVLKYVPFFTIS